MTKIERWGAEVARLAIPAGGSELYDHDGNCLLPVEPLSDDWEGLTTRLGRDPSDEEARQFEDGYVAVMRRRREGWDGSEEDGNEPRFLV